MAAVIAIVAALGIPAYANETQPAAANSSTEPAIANPAPIELQSLTVPAAAPFGAPVRDGYLVMRADTAGFQPYAHIADTFTNDPNSPIQWPFTVGVPISSGFGYRSCAGCSSYHQGIDFTPGEGTPIQAIADGTVIEVGGPYGSLGVYVMIEHQIDGERIVSVYAHMLEDSSPLAVGQPVLVGQLVGQVGNTGQSTGAHLHFGLLVNGTEAIDPYPWMKEHAGG